MAVESVWIDVPTVVSEEYISASKNRSQMDALQSRDLYLKDKFSEYSTSVEVDAKISGIVQSIDWKETVATFGELEATYPNPEEGWTVNVADTNYTYRYDSESSSWIPISANAIPLATSDINGLMSSGDYDSLRTLLNETVPNIILRMSQIEQKSFPLGTIIPYTLDETVPPNGFLFAEGQLVLRSDYPELWSKLYLDDPDNGYDLTVSDDDRFLYPGSFTSGDGTTTFRLPDLRGLFIRGWDAGKGYDYNRELTSLQNDNIRKHSHTFEAGVLTSYDTNIGSASNTAQYSNDPLNVVSLSTAEYGSEEDTRPKNVSLRYLIKVVPSERIATTGTPEEPPIETPIDADTLKGYTVSYTSSPNTIPLGNPTTGKLDSSWVDVEGMSDKYVAVSKVSSTPMNYMIPTANSSGKLDDWISYALDSDIDTVFNSVFA